MHARRSFSEIQKHNALFFIARIKYLYYLSLLAAYVRCMWSSTDTRFHHILSPIKRISRRKIAARPCADAAPPLLCLLILPSQERIRNFAIIAHIGAPAASSQ